MRATIAVRYQYISAHGDKYFGLIVTMETDTFVENVP